MKVKKTDLKEALEIVKPGLAGKEMIEQSTSFAFLNGEVITFNDNISLRHPVPGLEIEGAIKATELYELLSKMKSDEIVIHEKEKELVIKAGKSKAWFTLTPEVLLPIDSIGKMGSWEELPEDFSKALRFAAGACAQDFATPVLTCVHVEQDGMISGTDRFRIATYQLSEKLPVDTFLIPQGSINEVVKLNPTKIASGEGWIHFGTEKGTVLSCRTMKGDFPDCTPFLKKEGPAMEFPESALEALERVAVFSKREIVSEEEIKVTFTEGKITFESQSDYGRAKEYDHIDYEGDEISFAVTPYLLRDILAETRQFTFNKKRLTFKGDKWYYITIIKMEA